jgi:periplasmic mercuric ion binding protein
MKTLSFIAFLFLSMTLMAQKPDKASFNELYLSVNMDCHSCETKIAEQLKFEKGVRDLKCDFKSNTVYVKYKPGSNTDEKLMQRVEKMEYKVEKISKADFDAKNSAAAVE